MSEQQSKEKIEKKIYLLLKGVKKCLNKKGEMINPSLGIIDKILSLVEALPPCKKQRKRKSPK